MISLAPKSYRANCLDSNNTKIGQKGIPIWFQNPIEQYKSVLYDENISIEKAVVGSLRVDQMTRKMTRTSLKKNSLTGIFIKRRVKEDLISTDPLTKDGVQI